MAASPGRAGTVDRSERGGYSDGAPVNCRDDRSLTSGQEEGMNLGRVGPVVVGYWLARPRSCTAARFAAIASGVTERIWAADSSISWRRPSAKFMSRPSS